MIDVHRSQPMRPVHVGRWLRYVNMPWIMRQTMNNVAWLLPFPVGLSPLPEEHIPYFVLPGVGRCWYCPVNAYTPWLIRVGLGWFFLHLANIGFMMITSLGWCCLMLDDENVVQSMHKSHERCVESLADAAFHSTTFLAEWLHSTSDV